VALLVELDHVEILEKLALLGQIEMVIQVFWEIQGDVG
jgi:hypothetical protein